MALQMTPPLAALLHGSHLLLGDGSTFGQQLDAVHQLHALFVSLGGVNAQAPSVSQDETLLPQGLALGPVRAAQTAFDFLRTRVFLQGVRAALTEATRNRSTPVHVLYAGCGPYAMLALPLMHGFSAQSVRWTLLDVHPGSISSVRRLLEAFGLEDRVERLLVQDGCTFTWDGPAALDGLVCESMAAGLYQEDHVALLTHLAPQLAPDAFVVPQVVEVDVMMAHAGRVTQLTLTGSVPVDWLRHLGRVATLTVDTARQGVAAVLHGFSGVMPPAPTQGEYRLELHTRIVTFGDHVLEGLQSGLTAPRALLKPEHIRWGSPFSVEYNHQGPAVARVVFASAPSAA